MKNSKLVSVSLMALMLGTTHALAQTFVIDLSNIGEAALNLNDDETARVVDEDVTGGFRFGVDIKGDRSRLTNNANISSEEKTAVRVNGNGVFIFNNKQISGGVNPVAAGQNAAYGIDINGDNAYIENRGTISAGGFGVIIDAENANTGQSVIHNYGTISGTGENGGGILLEDGDGHSVTNFGTLNGDYGILSRSGLSDLLSRESSALTLVAVQRAAPLLSASDRRFIENRGVIRANKAGIVDRYSDTIIENTGNIEAAKGIVLGGDSTLVGNAGTIKASTMGIESEAGTGGFTIINSGKIIIAKNSDGKAIKLENSDGNEVVLAKGSVIDGEILISGAGNSLVLEKGFRGVLKVDDGGTDLAVLADGQLLSVNGNTYVVIERGDVQVDADARYALTYDLTRSVFSSLDRRAYDLRQCADEACKVGFWSSSELSASSANGDVKQDAAIASQTIGFDASLGEGKLIGIVGGYAKGKAERGSTDVDQDTAFVGAYYNLSQDNTFIDLGVLAGYNWIEASRLFANNTSASGGDIVEGKGKAYFVSPSITLGHTTQVDDTSFTPSIQARFTHFSVNDFSEQHAAAFSYEKQTGQRLDIRSQLTTALVAGSEDQVWNANLRTGVDFYQNWGGKLTASFGGEDFLFKAAADERGARAFVGADAGVKLTDAFAIKADAEVAYDTAKVVSGKLSLGGSLSF